VKRPLRNSDPAVVLRVGLTGGIATGKSEVAQVFRDEGAFVLDADLLGHALMEPGTPAFAAIGAAFGKGILAPDGRIDRKLLGGVIFQDEKARKRLNAILHPLILSAAERQVEEFAVRSPGGIAVTQAALLVETGAYRKFDRLVVTHCERAVQVRRLKARDWLSEEEADHRIRAQADPQARLDAADYVIDTSGDREETRGRAKEVFAALRREWNSRKAHG